MGIETYLLGEYMLVYAFFVYGMICHAVKHSNMKMPGFPVQAPDDDRKLMVYWMHTHGIIKKKGLRFLGIKQSTIDAYHEEEMVKYNSASTIEQRHAINRYETNKRSSDALFDAIHTRNMRNK